VLELTAATASASSEHFAGRSLKICIWFCAFGDTSPSSRVFIWWKFEFISNQLTFPRTYIKAKLFVLELTAATASASSEHFAGRSLKTCIWFCIFGDTLPSSRVFIWWKFEFIGNQLTFPRTYIKAKLFVLELTTATASASSEHFAWRSRKTCVWFFHNQIVR
jgi:hypothetical protein